ncbi:MAG: ScpA family protein [Alphaproteobacteria bacterium]
MGEQLIVDLEGYEGPLDVLLTLAREQKVDLTKISILKLADQYLEFVAKARKLRLELAADYLVMAAWLAYLKSRLLLPKTGGDDEPSGPEMAAALQFQLRRLDAMRDAAARMMARPRKGVDFWGRGEVEDLPVITKVVYDVKLYDLLKAYGDQKKRGTDTTLEIRASFELYSVEEAARRLGALLGQSMEWTTLLSFLPAELQVGLNTRSAVASTFVASLEMAKAGQLELRQDEHFGPIYVRTHQSRDDRK